MNRITPNLPPQDYKTYQVIVPKSTHFRRATCEEINCSQWQGGWKTILPADHELIEVVHHSGRKFVETKLPEGLIEFVFEAGQSCFQSQLHQIRVDKPELFVVTGGDWRGNPRGIEPRRFSRPDDWVDDFANHQDKIKTLIEHG